MKKTPTASRRQSPTPRRRARRVLYLVISHRHESRNYWFWRFIPANKCVWDSSYVGHGSSSFSFHKDERIWGTLQVRVLRITPNTIESYFWTTKCIWSIAEMKLEKYEPEGTENTSLIHLLLLATSGSENVSHLQWRHLALLLTGRKEKKWRLGDGHVFVFFHRCTCSLTTKCNVRSVKLRDVELLYVYRNRLLNPCKVNVLEIIVFCRTKCIVSDSKNISHVSWTTVLLIPIVILSV